MRPMDIASCYLFVLKADVHDRSVQYPIPAVSLPRSEQPRSAVCHERRASTTARNCTRDEGRSFGAGSQVLASNRCKLLSSKAMVVSVAVNVGTISRRVRVREARASEPPMKCRKRLDDVRTGGWHFLRDQ